jgi:hypothetical protein
MHLDTKLERESFRTEEQRDARDKETSNITTPQGVCFRVIIYARLQVCHPLFIQ